MKVVFCHRDRIGFQIFELQQQVEKDDTLLKRKSVLIHHLLISPRTSASPAQAEAAHRWVIMLTDFLEKQME